MELLQRRKFCREFLNGYNERLHPQIISKVFEIGLLFLKKQFNKLLFTKEELDDIIKALNGKEYVEIVPLPPLKKLEKLPHPSQKYPPPPQKIEQYYFNTENNNNENLLKTKIIKTKKNYENTLENPNFTTQNSSIYPYWWWNNKEEEMEKSKNNFNITYNEENIKNIKKDGDYENNNYEIYQENNNNDEDYINIKIENENDNENAYNNYNKYQDKTEIENNEMKNKNYTIKKLTMNSGKENRKNKYENPKEGVYYEKIQNYPKNIKALNNSNNINNVVKAIQMQRVKSSKPSSRKMNSFTKNKLEAPKNKLFQKIKTKIQETKDVKHSKIPRNKYTYANGRIFRVSEKNRKNNNLTMTEPNIKK